MSRKRRRFRVWGAFLGLLGASILFSLTSTCSLGSVDELTNGTCPSGTKLCRPIDAGSPTLTCVPLTDPSYGCGRDSCIPCYLPHAAEVVCSDSGECRVGTCADGFFGCDGDPLTGCEHSAFDDAGCEGVTGMVPNGEPDGGVGTGGSDASF